MEAKKCGWCGKSAHSEFDAQDGFEYVDCVNRECFIGCNMTALPLEQWNALMDRLGRTAALEAALGPFAAEVEDDDDAFPDDTNVVVKLGSCRAARRAMEAGR